MVSYNVYALRLALGFAIEDRNKMPMTDRNYQAACDRVTDLQLRLDEAEGDIPEYYVDHPWKIP